MKLNPAEWRKLPANTWIEQTSGEVIVHATEKVALIVKVDGGETTTGYADRHTAVIRTNFGFKVIGSKTAQIYVKRPEDPVFVSKGEIYTNPDRAVNESSNLNAVTRALRRFKREEAQRTQALLKAARDDADRYRADVSAKLKAFEERQAPPSPEDKSDDE